ncbi:MAG TPA: hypothetical protein VN618_04130 [Solirubrobacteraceae bacterium]|nr:hypothetical protein [Solirubrobacteraceae bacterium]
MPTSEQRGHFGLSWSGGGIVADAIVSRILARSSSVLVRSASVNGIVTRFREPTK